MISFIDPDDVIKKYDLGATVTNDHELEYTLKEFLKGRMPDQVHIKEYFYNNHYTGVIDQYRTLFNSLNYQGRAK